MIRGRVIKTLTAGILGGAMLAAVSVTAAQADDKKLELSGSATITTDYMFRSISNSSNNPAVQPEFDATYGMFWAYIWGSNTSFSPNDIELDYGVGIAASWQGIDFNIGGLFYTFPGSSDLDYFELKTAASYTLAEKWTFSVGNWWSPDNFGLGIQSDALELGLAYAFSGKIFNFFSPSVSGLIGWQWFEDDRFVDIPDYTYWNVGLTLGFLDNWSADIRYYDTDYSKGECFQNTGETNLCDARVVGAIKATF